MHKTKVSILGWALVVSFAYCSIAAQTPSGKQASGAPADIVAIVKETQHLDQRNNKLGMFWWMPVEYWEQSAISTGMSAEQARESFAPLREYSLVIVAVGNLGLASVNWIPDAEVRKNIVQRDRAGNTYKPLEKISSDAQGMVDVFKPALKNVVGPMADGLNLYFFPAKDASGKEITDPLASTEFSLVVMNLMGGPEPTSTYTWRLPVSALMPPKFCPVGKEKVEANWKYCPWHGNKLDTEVAPPTPPANRPKP